MTVFARKPLVRTATLGERLKEVRQESQLTLEQVAAVTGVSRHHLEAFEQGAYSQLPGDIYTRNFLRRYATFLKLNEERVLESYDNERRLVRPPEKGLTVPKPLQGGLAVSLISKRIAVAVAILAILGYLGWELGKLITPPTLVVESPAANLSTASVQLEVRGHTDPESSVTINGQAAFVNEQGQFRETLTLHQGRNTIQVTAVKKQGKRYTVTREVVLEQAPSTTNTDQPPAVTS